MSVVPGMGYGSDSRRGVLVALPLVLASALFSIALLRIPETLRVEIGPSDQRYAFGLAGKWSFDPNGRYRALDRRARFDFPATVRGPGTITVWVRGSEGALQARFDDDSTEKRSFARSEKPQPVTFELPRERLRANVRLRLETPSPGGTELSALSWESAEPMPRLELFFASGLLLVGPFATALAARGTLAGAAAASVGTGALLLVASAVDPVGALHVTLRSPPVVLLGFLVVLLSTRVLPRLSPSFRMLVYFALVARSAMVLHPSFYFSDIEMHEVLVERGYHRGFSDLFARWQEYAGGMGLGASLVESGRAAFPYPILFHGVTHVGNSLWHAPVTWLKLNGALFSAMALLPIGCLARRWSGGVPGAELLAGGLYLLVPCLAQNLLLLKFSAAAGHFFDLAVVAYLAHVSLSIDGIRRWLVAALSIGASLASYNSGFVHMGLLVSALLLLLPLLGGMRRRSAIGLATAALTAVPLGLVSYQPDWVRDFVSARVAESETTSAAEGPSPASGIDAPAVKAVSYLGLPVLVFGLLGAVRVTPKLDPASRLLAGAWLVSALAAHGLRYLFPVLLLQQKEAYWAGGALAVMGGLLLARLWQSGNGWWRTAAILALAASGLEWARWFSSLQKYFYSSYLFQ